MLLGLDLGGTKVAGVLMSSDGRQLATGWNAHRARGLDEVCALLSTMALELTSGMTVGPITAAGISVAGMVGADGLTTRRGLLELDHDDIAGPLEAATGLQMLVFNDAEATLRAAIAHDVDTRVSDAVLLGLGTGVAGAVMWRGQMLRGRVGLAGELGHMPVREPLPYPCVCGGHGCLEQYASGRGVAERAVAAARAGHADGLLSHAGVTADDLTAVHVVAAARQGDPCAHALLDDAADALAQTLVAVAVTTEPTRIYLGGSLGHAAADLLLPRIDHHLHRRWPFADTLAPPPLVLDNVGPHAAAVGAALLALDQRAPAR